MMTRPHSYGVVETSVYAFSVCLLPNESNQPIATLTSIETKPKSKKLACVKKFMYNTVAVPQRKPVIAAREPMRGKKIPMRNRPPMAPLSSPRMVLK